MPFQILPLWVQFGAFFLSLNAGMINVLGLVTVLHQSVSHMTGNVSLFAIAVLQAQTATIIYLGLIVVSYVIGSFLSGFILGNSQFSLGLRYGLPLSLVAILILICWFTLPYFPRYALLWASLAMGIQNAMFSHYKGAIIRTTHLSGVLTDLGLALGYYFRGLKVERRRVILHLLILFGFIFGGLLASLIYPILKINAFLVPALLSCLLSGVYWVIYFRYHGRY